MDTFADLVPVRAAAIAAAAGFVGIAVFQAALALGAPLGRAAWGGSRTYLPTGLRIASAIAVVVWLIAAVVVLRRAGFDLSVLPHSVARWGTWVLVGVLTVGTLMNLASRSRLERYIWGPVSLLLAALCLVVATD